MAQQSLLQQAKELETHVNRLLMEHDVQMLGMPAQRAVGVLKNQLADARLDVRDYELAETRAEQLEAAKAAQTRFEELQRSILKASEYQLLSAIDVAHMSALAQKISTKLA